MALILGCLYALIRKLFGKKRHGEKNKQAAGGTTPRGGFAGLKGLFGGGKGTTPADGVGQLVGIGGNKVTINYS
jgi:hypothetical protein